MNAQVRTFDSGATRNLDAEKLDFEGFLSPLVLERYAQYMHKHRQQADGTLRDSDNWQKGIPLPVYLKSAYRHFFDVWKEHRGLPTNEGLEDSLCALLFNIMGYLHEHLKAGDGQVDLSHLDEMLVPAEGLIAAGDGIGPSGFWLREAGQMVAASVPPYATRDADDPMGLSAGSAG